jgi:hypothetical protein
LVVEAGQVPLPSQVAALVWTPEAQLWARQLVLVSQSSHLPPPSQVPLKPQLEVADLTHRLPGSFPPSGTLVQVPTCPCTKQLVQVPVHELLQHTPWTQFPLWH